MATDNSIELHQFEDGNKAILVKFGKGKVGIGLGANSEYPPGLVVHLQELNEAKDVGSFLTKEERIDNFNNQASPLEVIIVFPDVKSIDNFIETLKIYEQKVFFPNVRTRSA